jgi:hypothetical protein
MTGYELKPSTTAPCSTWSQHRSSTRPEASASAAGRCPECNTRFVYAFRYKLLQLGFWLSVTAAAGIVLGFVAGRLIGGRRR